jgi:hypothetical protein
MCLPNARKPREIDMAEERNKTLKAGDEVTWDSSQGEVTGTVEKKLTSPMKIKSHEVKASKENPEYLVKSEKTGAEAAHKPEELRTN